MNQDQLYQDFPLAVRCESSSTVVFVTVPRGARYGDVRKTLAALLNRPYASVHIAPIPLDVADASGDPVTRIAPGTEMLPYPVDSTVEESAQCLLRAQILSQNEKGTWVAE